MKNKIYYLKTCDTCKKIMSQIEDIHRFELQDVKEHPLTIEQLDELYTRTNDYEILFNKRAKLYKELDLKDKNLTAEDYKKYILEHYTFLARPVVLFEGKTFVGNGKKTIENLLSEVNQ